jgi:chromosomal replication initiation ATPase DnaA
MPPQLRLTFDETWSYSSETFLIHAGVAETIDRSIALATSESGTVIFVSGESRSGKTHTAVYIAAMLQALQHSVTIARRDDISDWLKETEAHDNSSRGALSLIIDDAHIWLEEQFGEGLFEVLINRVAQTDGVLILMSSKPLWQLRINPTIEKSLSGAESVIIASPTADEIGSIFDSMSLQRGLKFSPSKKNFILKRVGHTLQEISGALDRIQAIGQHSHASTAFRVLGEALNVEKAS